MLDNLTKAEILELARTDKKSLLASKSAQVKYTDSLAYTVAKPSSTKEASSKADEPVTLSADGTLDVTIVCNTAWFVDSQMDVLTDKCYSKSVAEKGASIPHIADHKQSSTSHVGDVTKVYTKELPLAELGYGETSGSTTALVMESTVRKDYNEDVYKFYKNGKINQHSIGLRYVDIQLAINSKHEDDKEEFAVWEEGYESIINKEVVDEKGYFWLVKEINIIENSCVLFGANSLTPTLEVKSDTEESSVVKTITPTENNLSTTKGSTMTPLEVALAKNLELTSEVAELKAQVTASTVVAVATEKTRVLGILKSANVLGVDQELAIKRISSKSSVEDATEIFTAVAEATQKGNELDTSGQEPSTVNSSTINKGSLSFSEQLDVQLKEAPTEPLFKGMK